MKLHVFAVFVIATLFLSACGSPANTPAPTLPTATIVPAQPIATLAPTLPLATATPTQRPATFTPTLPPPSTSPTQRAATAAPTQSGNTVGGITNTSVRIVQEQGSGAICTASSTYFVYLDITSNGRSSALYEINATDASGQVADGVFSNFASPAVRDALTFNTAETKSIALRLVGPYSYPAAITIRARVNGGEWKSATVACK